MQNGNVVVQQLGMEKIRILLAGFRNYINFESQSTFR